MERERVHQASGRILRMCDVLAGGVRGVWLGINLESGQSVVGASYGVMKARDFRRKPEEG